ncbi:MAG: cell division protein SepF [Lachnospiraceae bacterium]
MSIVDRMKDLFNFSYDDDDQEYDDEEYEAEEEAKRQAKLERQAERQRLKEEKREARQRAAEMENQAAVRNERPAIRTSSGISLVGKGGNNKMAESEIVSIRPKDDKSKQEIGRYLLDGKTVLINLEGMDLDVAQRIVDFTYGVCFAIHGDMKFPSKYLVVAAPNGVGMSGAFESAVKPAGSAQAGGNDIFNN